MDTARDGREGPRVRAHSRGRALQGGNRELHFPECGAQHARAPPPRPAPPPRLSRALRGAGHERAGGPVCASPGCPSGAGAAPARSGCGGSACAVAADRGNRCVVPRAGLSLEQPSALASVRSCRAAPAPSLGEPKGSRRASRAALSRAAAQVLGVRGGRQQGCPPPGARGAPAKSVPGRAALLLAELVACSREGPRFVDIDWGSQPSPGLARP